MKTAYRRSILASLATVILLGALPAFAAVESVGTIPAPPHPPGRSPALGVSAYPVLVEPPTTVVQEENTSNTEVLVFDELQGVELAEDLPYDQLFDLTDPGVIPAGTVVNSHFVHLDNVGTWPGVRGVGTITFDGPVLGLITQDANMYASDPVLGWPDTTYPVGSLYNALEEGTGGFGDYPERNWRLQDILSLSDDQLTLTIDLQVFDVLDHLRVVTAPATTECVVDLIADGGSDDTAVDVGDVTVTEDGDGWNVTYATTGEWVITELHLDVVCSLDQFPMTGSGNPKVGRFCYAAYPEPPVTEYTFEDVNPGECENGSCDCTLFAAHAVVVDEGDCWLEQVGVDPIGNPIYEEVCREETAWGYGEPFPGRNWAMYFECGDCQ